MNAPRPTSHSNERYRRTLLLSRRNGSIRSKQEKKALKAFNENLTLITTPARAVHLIRDTAGQADSFIFEDKLNHMLDQVAALGDQMDRKNGILIGESLSEESKRRRDDVIDTGAFGIQASGSDVVFFQGVLPDINRTVRGSEPIDKQIEMCLDQLELMLETVPGTSWTS